MNRAIQINQVKFTTSFRHPMLSQAQTIKIGNNKNNIKDQLSIQQRKLILDSENKYQEFNMPRFHNEMLKNKIMNEYHRQAVKYQSVENKMKNSHFNNFISHKNKLISSFQKNNRYLQALKKNQQDQIKKQNQSQIIQKNYNIYVQRSKTQNNQNESAYQDKIIKQPKKYQKAFQNTYKRNNMFSLPILKPYIPQNQSQKIQRQLNFQQQKQETKQKQKNYKLIKEVLQKQIKIHENRKLSLKLNIVKTKRKPINQKKRAKELIILERAIKLDSSKINLLNREQDKYKIQLSKLIQLHNNKIEQTSKK